MQRAGNSVRPLSRSVTPDVAGGTTGTAAVADRNGAPSSHGRWVLALTTPLRSRIRRGEGQIVLVALALAVVQGVRPFELAALGALLTVLLASLYAFNDVCDSDRDSRDPDKDRENAAFLSRHGRVAMAILVAVQLGLLGVAAVALPEGAALAVAVVVSVNAAYCLRLKGIPGLDVACAPLWGGAFAGIGAAAGGAAPIPVLALCGVMTTVCHLFQARRDVGIDTLNGVRTISVTTPRGVELLMAGCCVALAALLAALVHPVVGATAAVPFLLSRSPVSNERAWLGAKLWFGVVFLAVLGGHPWS